MLAYPPKTIWEKKDNVESIFFFFFESFKSVNKHLTQWFSAEAEPLPRGSFRTFELTFLDCHNVWGYDWHLVNGNQRR